jgi:hypothetical protein
VDWERHLCGFPRPSDRFQKPAVVAGPPRSVTNTYRDSVFSGVVGAVPGFPCHSVDEHYRSRPWPSAAAEINLIPTKVAHLRGAEPVPARSRPSAAGRFNGEAHRSQIIVNCRRRDVIDPLSQVSVPAYQSPPLNRALFDQIQTDARFQLPNLRKKWSLPP